MGRRATGTVEVRETSLRLKFRWQGRRVAEKLDLDPTPRNIKAAEKLLEDIQRRIELGVFRYADFFPESAQAEAGGSTFRDLGARWLKTVVGAKSTIASYQTALNFWYGAFGDEGVKDIRQSDIKEAIAEKAAEGISGKTLNNYLVAGRGVFALAVGDKHLTAGDNPMVGVENLSFQSPEPEPLDIEEMNLVADYMAGHYHKAVWAYFEFAFNTGLRPSEQIALDNKHIDWRKWKAKIEAAEVLGEEKGTKTNRIRWIDLNSRAVAALEAMKAFTFMQGPDARIFINPNTMAPWSGSQVQRRLYWRPALRGCGLAERDFYQTRHTYATINLMGGVNVAYISKQLGHAKVAMTLNRYARWIEGADKGAEASKMDALFSGKVPEKSHKEG